MIGGIATGAAVRPAARVALGRLARSLRRPVGRYVREGSATLSVLRPRRRRPRVAFLPNAGPSGSSLLRIYNVADDCARAGWSCLVVHPNLVRRQRDRILARMQADLVVVQGARHSLNRRDPLPDASYLLDLDDADFHDLTQALPLAALAAGVVAGSRCIAGSARRHNPNERVLEFVADVVTRLLDRHVPVITFRFHDMKPRDADRLPAVFDDPRVTLQCLPRMDYGAFVKSLTEVSVGLYPLRPESPSLAYLEAKVPVICNDAADPALFFTPASGIIVETPEELAAQVAALLSDPARREAIAEGASRDLADRLSTRTASALLRDFARQSVPSLSERTAG